ncbi:glycosyltransferase family 2 protein [Streptococcus pneumoniae]
MDIKISPFFVGVIKQRDLDRKIMNKISLTDNLPLISVVLPVYNVENYLEKCLNSVVRQTYKNIEIIIVNDGSLDSSIDICNKYANKDSRIKVFTKPNGGLSDARNFGIKKSMGEFITFVDSDDYVTDDYVEYLYSLVKKYNCKMSMCSIFVHYISNDKMINNGTGRELMMIAEQCIEKMCYHDEVDTCAYAKLYHRSLFSEICFPKGRIFEDIGTIYRFFDTAGQIACGFNAKYYYEIRENSIVTSSFSEKKFDLLFMTDQMRNFVDQRYPSLKAATKRRAVYARFSTLNQLLDVQGYNEEKKEIIRFIQDNKEALLENPKTPKRDRLAVRALSLGFCIYKLLWKQYLKIQRG